MKKVTPGECLGFLKDCNIGQNVYERNSNAYASVAGTLIKSDNIISVERNSDFQALKVGQTVICRVVRIKEDAAHVQIISVEGKVLFQYYEAIIRKQNIRQSEIDKLKMEECFLPNDIVVAKVLSYGDSRKIYLSTSENDLGVMFAQKQQLIPYSWETMICPLTHEQEKRKVAKPDFSLMG